jgi:1,4-alpha-glucan branching enzyme
MPMQRQGSSDVWKIAIALPPGRHVYSFVVDGTEWVIDPLAPRAELDDLGPANVIAISGAGD